MVFLSAQPGHGSWLLWHYSGLQLSATDWYTPLGRWHRGAGLLEGQGHRGHCQKPEVSTSSIYHGCNALCRVILVAAHADHIWVTQNRTSQNGGLTYVNRFLTTTAIGQSSFLGTPTHMLVVTPAPPWETTYQKRNIPRAVIFMIHFWIGMPSFRQPFRTFRRVRQARGITPSRRNGNEETMLPFHVAGP